MEFTFSALKQKDVINLIDGKHLGRVCDITFSFPENNVLGFTVTGCKGFRFSKQEVFLPIKSVVKIGTDAVLVKFGKEEKPDDCHPPKPDCRPDFCCPPPENRPSRGFPDDGSSRRDYGEYEYFLPRLLLKYVFQLYRIRVGQVLCNFFQNFHFT